jgi:hypothetical protein
MRCAQLLGINVIARVHHARVGWTTHDQIDLVQGQVPGIVPEHERHGVAQGLPAGPMPRYICGECGEEVRFELSQDRPDITHATREPRHPAPCQGIEDHASGRQPSFRLHMRQEP